MTTSDARLRTQLSSLEEQSHRLADLARASNPPTPRQVIEESAEEIVRDLSVLRALLLRSEP